MTRHAAARLTVGLNRARPIYDSGDALNLNVSESCLGDCDPQVPAAQPRESRDQGRQLRDAEKP